MLDTSRLRDLAINESGFAFDPTTGHTYNLNVTGLFILHALKDGTELERIVAGLSETFDTDPESDLTRDVGEFARQLREQGLLR